MTGFLDELQAAVTAAAERVGPAVIGLGRGWGRGSGVVIAEGRVLTNAHVLRGDEVAVRRADGEVAHGRVAGVDADLDVAVIARRHRRRAGGRRGSRPCVDAVARRRARLRARRPRRPRPAHDVRPRHRDRPQLPRPARAPHRRLDRALRPAAARLLGRPARRSRGPPARASTPCAWRAGCCSRSRPTPRCTPASRRSAAARRRPARGSASRSRRRAPRAGCAPPSACPSATACSCAASSPAAPPTRPACSAATCSSPRPAGRSRGFDDLFDALEAGGALALTVVRGTEEREVTAHFS